VDPARAALTGAEDAKHFGDRPGAVRRFVLVLDNTEHVATRSTLAGVVTQLLDAVAELVIVATSRSVLGLAGEHVVMLGPLALPPEDGCPLTEIGAGPAVRMFCDRAAAARPGFGLTKQNAAAVVDVCRLLGGLPSALELAAAQVRALTPEQLLERLNAGLGGSRGGAPDPPERQRSRQVALESSIELLDEAQAQAFAQLSVFGGGWTAEAAQAVLALDSGPGAPAAISGLIDRSLVVADGTGRMAMPAFVRDFAEHLLATRSATEAVQIRARYAKYCTTSAEALGPV
jgi:predicted ATPase